MSSKKKTAEATETDTPTASYRTTAEARATAGEIPVFCAFDELVPTAALTGRQYTGVDISEKQIEANRANRQELQATVGDIRERPTG